MTLATVVLAAGEGTRMRSALPKVLHPICGRPMLGHILAVTDALGAAETAVVLAADTAAQVAEAFGPRYRYAVQQPRLGTGHAALQARPALVGRADELLVLLGDAPLLRAETVRALLERRREAGARMALLSFDARPPTGYGRVLRDEAGRVAALVEERNATPAQRAVTECNSGIMCFDAAWLWDALERVDRNPVNGEYYLTDTVSLAVADAGPGAALAVLAEDPREAWGVNDRAQLAQVEAAMRERILGAIMRGGVTVVDPAATYPDAGVSVGRDSIIYPGTALRGATSIGAGCRIGPHTTLIDTRVGDGAQVRYTLAEGAEIAAGADVGPFAHLGSSTPRGEP